MKKIKIYIFAILAMSMISLLNSCKETEKNITPSGLEIFPKEAGLGTLLTIKGTNLSNIQKVTFGNVTAAFNPVYNTDEVFLLRVPEAAVFGLQKITLLNAGGEVTQGQIDFKVLQPAPSILDVQPLASSPGELITITGLNFTGKGYSPDVIVKIGDAKAEIVSIEKGKIVIKMPSGNGGVVKVTTGNTNIGGGESISKASIANENIFHMIADFDGGGSSDKSYWYTYGDVDGPFVTVAADPAPKSGKFMKMTNAKGTNKNGYVGASHDDKIVYDVSKVTTENTAIRLDVNSNGKKGTGLFVGILDSNGGNWYKTVKCDWDNWQSVTFKLSDLNFWYGTKKGDKIDGKKIVRVTVGFDNYKDLAQELNIDNIRFIEYK